MVPGRPRAAWRHGVSQPQCGDGRAARRAAESPGTSYNPLFVYSASGLGKSHLLNSIAHLIGSPVIFAVISRYYFKRLGHSSPLATALAFLLVVIGMDVFVVALIVNRSFEMFRSPLGT